MRSSWLSVLGRQRAGRLDDDRIVTKAAIDEILKYYHCKSAEIPDDIRDLDEQMEFCLRPHGLMRRSVRLEKGWYRDAFGPMLAFRREDGAAVARLPKPSAGYWFRDPESGGRIDLNRKTAELFEEDAICFYRPLPLKKLGIPDLIVYMKGCLNTGDFLCLAALMLTATLIGLLLTRITRALTGFVLESANVPLLWGTAVFMIAATLSSQLLDASKELMMNRIEIKTSLSVEAAMMMRVMNLPANFFRKYSSGELSSRYSAVNQLCELLLGNVFSTGLGALMSLLYITQIFHYAPALVGPALLILLASIAVSVVSALTQMKISRQIMEKGAKENGLSFSLISGVQKIKLAGAEKRAFAKWGRSYAEVSELIYNPPILLRANGAITTAISLVGTIVITGVALSVAKIRPILEMAEPILKTEPESAENKTMVTKLGGNIELSNVYFRYTPNMPYVVNGMSLKIRAGEYVAIVGSTGCGKSTLVRLLLGFETPEKGAVYYDGKDIAGLDLRSLRRRIGTVTQDGSLFQGDIFSNIVISAPQLSLDDAWEAAELAGIADDIRAMPMGMQTLISEGQGGISGGQKQRLMIARAVAPKPKILIFDEATSALDNKTQKQVSDALDALKCTRIVIAHRLSTIKNCDRILVLEGGKILEEGSYDELIAKNGFFAELVARQRLDV